MAQIKYKILLFLFFISLASSLVLTINEIKPSPLICDITEGCFVVSESPYSQIFGIENAYIGFAFFVLMFFMTLSQVKKPKEKKEKIIEIGVFIGGLWAVYSIYLMEFVINAYCKYCTVIDVSSLIAVAVAVYYRKK